MKKTKRMTYAAYKTLFKNCKTNNDYDPEAKKITVVLPEDYLGSEEVFPGGWEKYNSDIPSMIPSCRPTWCKCSNALVAYIERYTREGIKYYRAQIIRFYNPLSESTIHAKRGWYFEESNDHILNFKKAIDWCDEFFHN